MAKFLSAQKLGIEEWEREALIWTLENVLERRDTVSVDEDGYSIDSNISLKMLPLKKKTPVFVMSLPSDELTEYKCGSAGCIGGWMMMHKMGKNVGDKVNSLESEKIDVYVYNKTATRETLYPLFFGHIKFQGSVDLSKVTAASAGKVVRRFLEKGDRYWRHSDVEVR